MLDFTTLMKRRIRRILLVCNNYDSYSLEEDGHIESLIAADYLELNLSNPPAIVRVETTVQALELLQAGEKFDLAITMYNVGELDVFTFSHKAKECDPEMPVVLLCGYAKEIFRKIAEADKSCIDHVFCWNNSTDVIIAIIKLIEDDMNSDHDILTYGVQAILLVEDSVRYYSTYLPALYSIILHQNASAVRDALNEQQQKARKRARPKILMATNYDDALALYEKYKHNLLGVISDVGFVLHKGDLSKNEKLDAGVDLCKHIREDNPKMPFLMQSSQESIRKVAESLNVGFLQKSSKTLTYELEEYIGKHFGFGDFVVTDPATGAEVARAHDLAEFEQVMKTVPAEYFNVFSASNYLSKWLFARGLFQIGQVVRGFTVEGFASIEENRKKVVDLVHDFRIAQGLGVVAKFNPDTYNDTIWLASLGEGSLGGKARGLAFLNHILQKYNLYNEFEGTRLRVPKTLVVMTDFFEKFIIDNGLQYVINSDLSDEEILSEFVASRLPYELIKALKIFIRNTTRPLAIRSSSKLEDSYYQPFAGVYSTYMIPHTENEDQQLRLLTKAIKSVYASVYFASSRRYITAAANVISEEKMAIVIQEICGSEQGDYYFPTISGVARSVNFYPVGSEKSEDGIVKIAYGLGKAVVDGEQVLRFSPRQPKKALQISTPENTVSDTQKSIFALSLKPDSFKTSVDDAVNLERIPLVDCPKFASFAKVGSTWDRENMRIVDSTFPEGPKFITFASVLKYGTFPLAKIITRLLDIAKEEMKCDVEIEFAANLEASPAVFNVLQIRPISTDSRYSEVDWSSVDSSKAWLRSANALGTGWIGGVEDVVYIKREAFDTLKTREIAAEITEINSAMAAEKRGYVLVGFGRWGTSIDTLGVPVKWSDISEARVLVECCLEKFRVDPSQGTHFFQNLTSFNVGYINVDPFGRPSTDMLDFELLDSLPAVEETAYLRHVRLSEPLTICVDGRENRAVIS